MNCIKSCNLPAKQDVTCISLSKLEAEFRKLKKVTCVFAACEAITIKCTDDVSIVKVWFEDREGEEFVLVDGAEESAEENTIMISSNSKPVVQRLCPNEESIVIKNPIVDLVEHGDKELVLFLHSYIKNTPLDSSPFDKMSDSDLGDISTRRIATYKHAMLQDNEVGRLLTDKSSTATYYIKESHPVHYSVGTQNINIEGSNKYPLQEKDVVMQVNNQDFLKTLMYTDKYQDMKLCIQTDETKSSRVLDVKFVNCLCMKHSDSPQSSKRNLSKESQIQELAKQTQEQMEVLRGLNIDDEEDEDVSYVEDSQ